MRSCVVVMCYSHKQRLPRVCVCEFDSNTNEFCWVNCWLRPRMFCFCFIRNSKIQWHAHWTTSNWENRILIELFRIVRWDRNDKKMKWALVWSLSLGFISHDIISHCFRHSINFHGNPIFTIGLNTVPWTRWDRLCCLDRNSKKAKNNVIKLFSMNSIWRVELFSFFITLGFFGKYYSCLLSIRCVHEHNVAIGCHDGEHRSQARCVLSSPSRRTKSK